MKSSLPKFLQNYNIYLILFEKYKEDDDIQKQLAISSFKNLELKNLVELIKKIENEEKKIQLFENLGKIKIVSYEDFLNKEKTNNIEFLREFMKNKLIPEGVSYLEDNKDKLTTIFEKLSQFNEKKKVYLDTILNEDKKIKKVLTRKNRITSLLRNNNDTLEKSINDLDKYINTYDNRVQQSSPRFTYHLEQNII